MGPGEYPIELSRTILLHGIVVTNTLSPERDRSFKYRTKPEIYGLPKSYPIIPLVTHDRHTW